MMVRSAAAAVALAILASSAGGQTPASPIAARSTYEDLQMLTGVLNQLRVNHPDSLDSHALILAAIRGMVGAADPHSYLVVYRPLVAEKAKAFREGKLHAVGITFRFIGGSPVIVGTVAGSSAEKLDLLPGDELISIDGAPVAVESADELDIVLAGPRGSAVELGIERARSDGSIVRLTRSVKRERLDDASAVPAAFMVDSQTGYVRITTFAADKVAEDLHDALGRLTKAGMRQLVLDLRDNGGGSLAEAARVAGEFLPRGAIVYTTSGRKKELTDTGRVERSFFSREQRYPVVVLINEGTASASELVAGALQDHDRAVVVGRTSFGKSLIMLPFPLPDGSLLWMVTGQVRTPCGRVVQRAYRGLTLREYYRQSVAERDTAGRPTCTSTSGRTLFGGGGIYPDVVVRERELPAWFGRLYEEALPLKWVGAYVSGAGASVTLDALAVGRKVPVDEIQRFRALADQHGVRIPAGDDADALIQRALVPEFAHARWGAAGFYRLAALLDDEVAAATAGIARAATILGGGR